MPRPNTSNAKAAGRFSKAEFVYLPDQDAYRCPAGEMLTRYCLTKENDLTLIVYGTAACAGCPLKERCTTGQERRIRRWEHEAVLDALARPHGGDGQRHGGPAPPSIRSRPSKPEWEKPTSCAKA